MLLVFAFFGGAKLGASIFSRGCGASRYGFIRAANCHPYALPQVRSHLSPKPKTCGKLSTMDAGYCLCDDDDATTTIAAPKGCGTKPVNCERACAENPIVGQKPPECVPRARPECKDPTSHKNMIKPSKAMLHLARAFSKSCGADLGVSMPAGTRRDLMKDFVMYDRRMSPADVETVKRRVDKFKREAPRYPGAGARAGAGAGVDGVAGADAAAFNGRGVVIVGGSATKFATSYWVVVHAIRRAKSKLPIQLWFPAGETPDCVRTAELERLGVSVASFADFQGATSGGGDGGEMTNRFMYKLVALIFSSFEEVLLLDSDNIPLRDPAELFESEQYVSTGSLLWMDFWRGSSAPDCQAILGNATALRYTHESGQMLVKKSKTWDALALALFMNSHSEFFYPLTINYMGLGDKEIFSTALLHLGLPYGLVPHGPDHVGVRDNMAAVMGNTMLQHSPDGTPMFLHTNLGKPSGWVPASESTYVRRWQVSLMRGADLPAALEKATGVEDFEMWYYRLIRDRRCFFDDRPAKHWYLKLAHGPFLEGFHLTDHYNVNTDLGAFQGLIRQGYAVG